MNVPLGVVAAGEPMAEDSGQAALLARAKQGDQGALVSLLEAIGPEVRRRIEARITRALRSSIDADDVMQVTYLEAVTRIDRFEFGGVREFVAWLSRMAENNLIDAIRELEAAKRPSPKNRVSPGWDQSAVNLVEILGGTSSTPSRNVAAAEAVRFMKWALERLPPDYEKVIQMYDLDGHSVEEVAEAMGRSPGAVYMLRARAHDRLREEMGPQSKFFSRPS